MKASLVTTRVVFGLVTLAHIARVVAAGVRVAANPWFVLTTVAAATLCRWAGRLLRVSPRS
jgi:uncharacterized protein (DUF2062 family)